MTIPVGDPSILTRVNLNPLSDEKPFFQTDSFSQMVVPDPCVECKVYVNFCMFLLSFSKGFSVTLLRQTRRRRNMCDDSSNARFDSMKCALCVSVMADFSWKRQTTQARDNASQYRLPVLRNVD